MRRLALLIVVGVACQAQPPPAPAAPEPAGDTARQVTGIGIRPVIHAQGFAIGQLFPDGPAAEAGLREGDVVLAVDGEPTARWTLDRAATRLRSAAGTKVTLSVLRGVDRFEVMLVRRTVAVPERREL
jgi:C-terminal processing protease CtpA/Prc